MARTCRGGSSQELPSTSERRPVQEVRPGCQETRSRIARQRRGTRPHPGIPNAELPLWISCSDSPQGIKRFQGLPDFRTGRDPFRLMVYQIRTTLPGHNSDFWQAAALSQHGSMAGLPRIVAAAQLYHAIWCRIPSECVFPLGVTLGRGNTFSAPPQGLTGRDPSKGLCGDHESDHCEKQSYVSGIPIPTRASHDGRSVPEQISSNSVINANPKESGQFKCEQPFVNGC